MLDDLMREAERQLSVCTACRFCEGYCAVFPALERRDAFTTGDITYLANLCHDCRDCFDACMFTPPHVFNVNLPQILSEVRVRTYEQYAWPAVLRGLFRHAATWTALVALVAVAALLTFVLQTAPPGALVGPGAFYRVVPYLAMIIPALAITLYGLVVVAAGAIGFVHDTGASVWDFISPGALRKAAAQAITLHYMKGGGSGCVYPRERGSHARRILHGFVFWGFAAAFASTCLAGIYQDLFGILPPFGFFSAPVVLGLAGGVLLSLGASGLIALKLRSDPVPASATMTIADYAFLVVLDAVGITGLVLLFLRSTPAMAPLLAIHLGLVAAFFITAPYSKFVHFVYRVLALIKNSLEEEAASS